jgi:hypothetical protein
MTRMRQLVIIFLLLGKISLGQRDYFYIKGKVTDRDDSTKRIYGLKARVSFNDSLFFETDCDSLGRYSFELSRNFPRAFKTQVTIRQDKNILSKLFPPSKECPFFSKIPDQYLTQDSRTISYKDKLADFIADFTLIRMCIDRRYPCISFQKNSTKLIRCSGDDPDTTIYCLKNVMIENPTIVAEVVGRAWEEKNTEVLSLRRAHLIKEKLVAYGVDSGRISVLGYADSKPPISAKEIEMAKMPVKEDLKSINRSIIFRIIAFDYDPKAKKRITADKKN